jgi:glutamine amidotransferase
MLEFSSAIQKNNFYAVQFHPEKSGEGGQKILENFIFGI